MPNLVIYIDQTPICDWYMAMCGSKNGCWKDICSKEIGPCAQNLLTIKVSRYSEHKSGGWGDDDVFSFLIALTTLTLKHLSNYMGNHRSP